MEKTTEELLNERLQKLAEWFYRQPRCPQCQGEHILIDWSNADIYCTTCTFAGNVKTFTPATPEKKLGDWGHKHLTALRNAIFATIPEAEKSANMDDEALVAWPAKLAAQNLQLQTALRKAERVKQLAETMIIHGNCPFCGRGMPGHHAPDCQWAAALLGGTE